MSNNAAHDNNSYHRLKDEVENLRAFDRLPPAIRQALNDASYPYSAPWILDRLNRGTSIKAMIDDIRQSDRSSDDLVLRDALADLGRQVAKIKADIMSRLVGRRRIR
jgi:hypothetical protein